MSTSTKESKEKIAKKDSIKKDSSKKDKDELNSNQKRSGEFRNGDAVDPDQSIEELQAPTKKIHTEETDNPFADMDPTLQGEKKPSEGTNKKKKKGDESDSEYEMEGEDEDYLDDDGEITSEHSEKSGDFNLEEYLKFREKAPDYSDEEGNGEGEAAGGEEEGDEGEDEEEGDDEDEL